MKQPVTLVLLADEGGFALLEGNRSALAEIARRDAQDFENLGRDPGEGSDKGRNRAGPGGGISFGNVERSNVGQVDRARLARHATAALAGAWAGGRHDRILISAGPKMLGALREALPEALRPHVAGEAHKDLMRVAAHDLPGQLEGL